MKTRLFGVIGLLVLCLSLSAAVRSKPQIVPKSQPNIILIVTDDQWVGSEFAMPLTQAKLWDRSVIFNNAYVTTPLCCPARAGILSGQYGHTNGVLRNSPPHGGYPAFDDSESLPVWLDRAGYETALYGKYLNRYDGGRVPPGWDDWWAFTITQPPMYYTYNVRDLYTITQYENARLSTDVIFDKGIQFVQNNSDNPFFLMLAVSAPHPTEGESPVDPQDAGLFEDYVLTSPSFNEADMSDKPLHMQALPLLDEVKVTNDIRDLLRSLAPVDRGIDRLLTTLESEGLMDNTIIIFVSDNGMLNGSHRHLVKIVPYEESIRVPLTIYAPKYKAGTSDALVLNIDIAPTILDLAGVSPSEGYTFDGVSIRPILKHKSRIVRDWFWIEQLQQKPFPPNWWGVHTVNNVYIEYVSGEREFYDLAIDPYQLENRVADPSAAAEIAVLEERLNAVRMLMQPYLP